MRSTLLLLISVFVVLQFQFWIGDGGLMDLVQLQYKVDDQIRLNQEKRERNLALKAEVIDLRHGLDAIEERSRRDLGLIKQGETFFQIIDRKKRSQN